MTDATQKRFAHLVGASLEDIEKELRKVQDSPLYIIEGSTLEEKKEFASKHHVVDVNSEFNVRAKELRELEIAELNWRMTETTRKKGEAEEAEEEKAKEHEAYLADLGKM